jgi:UDP-3-O-[3-hydroxymyristoyl] N-acetylglucosamine deacetylase/3-hydroxyacyl-[acyl-carrier-protein] dehydratase
MVHPNILLKLLKKLKSKSKMPKEIFVVKEVISFTDEASGSEILVMPNDHYSVTAMVDFGTKILGTKMQR